MVKVGLLTVEVTPRPRAIPWVKAVLPAPSAPCKRMTSPETSSSPSSAPSRCVSARLRLTSVASTGGLLLFWLTELLQCITLRGSILRFGCHLLNSLLKLLFERGQIVRCCPHFAQEDQGITLTHRTACFWRTTRERIMSRSSDGHGAVAIPELAVSVSIAHLLSAYLIIHRRRASSLPYPFW